ncbi:MAG: autotransporter-associated beta strand repeat-containing protein [Tepidisphaeraceae bacterium]
MAITQTVTGSFRSEVDRWKGLAFGNDSNLYVQPSLAQQAAFRACLADLWSGSHQGAGTNTVDTQAAAFGYEYIRFNDTDTGMTYYGLREVLTGGAQTKGWGITFVNFSATSNTMVEVPHVLFDTNTEDLGARTFQDAGARGFTMAGAHRNANGFGTADVARLDGGSTFQVAHEVMNGPAAQTVGWQIHGFDLDGIPTFPADTAAVMTNGNGTVTAPQRDLNARYDAVGFPAYGYNTLSSSNPLNVELNTATDGTVYPGTTFDDLGATGNHQGAYSRSLGGAFMHVEHEQLIRFSTANRTLAASQLGDSMRATSPLTATTLKKWDSGNGAGSSSWTVNSGANWSTDGLPTAADTIQFDNSLVATLPVTMTLTAQNITVRGIAWDSNQSSTLASATNGTAVSTVTLMGDGPVSTMPLLKMGASAVSSTFIINSGNTGTGTGEVELVLNASGNVEVSNPNTNLVVNARIRELGVNRRLTKTGNGTATLGNSGNSFTGGVTVKAGILGVPAIGALGTSPSTVVSDFIRLDGGTLRYTGGNATMSTTRGITTVSSGSIDVTAAATTLSYNGVVAGGGSLNKVGTGTLQLGGANTFTGATIVTAGRLQLASPTALGATSAGSIVTNGATMELFGSSSGLSYTSPEPLMVAGIGTSGAGGALIATGSAGSTFGGPLTLSADATISNQAAGVLRLTGGVSGSAGLTVAGSSGVEVARLRVNQFTLTAPRLTLASVATLGSTSRITGLSLAAGQTLDLSTGTLVVDYTGTSPASSLRALLATAYAGGAWNGAGLTSSAAGGSTMLGMAEASRVSFTTVDDITLDGTSIVIRRTCAGDTNLDGSVNFTDLLALAARYGNAGIWDQGDFNYDGTVNFADLLALAANYGSASGTLSNGDLDRQGGFMAQVLVPEPCSPAIAVSLLLPWTRRTRR